MRVALLSEEGIGEVAYAPTPTDPADAVAFIASHAPAERAIGGIAAILDAEGGIENSTNIQSWIGYTFGKELAERIKGEVTVVNDTEIAALGEAVYGAGRDFFSIAYIGIGTGVGTAHVADKKVMPGTSKGVERMGIITLEDGTTLEERIGGRSLLKTHGMPAKELPAAVWSELTPLLAEGVYNAFSRWEPDAVILGGSLINEENGFKVEEVARTAHDTFETPLRVFHATLGSVSGLWGAKALASGY